MQLKLKDAGDNQKQLEVTLPKEQAAQFFNKSAQKLSTRHKIEGFRSGQAPFSVVAKKLGAGPAYQEAAILAVQATFDKALQEKNLTPLGQPEIKISKISPNSELQYKATIATSPQIKLPELSQLKTPQKPVKVVGKEIDKVLEVLRKKRASRLEVARPAQSGDILTIDVELRAGGTLIEGGSQSDLPVKLGLESFLPGFDKNLIGAQAGQTKSFRLTLPKQFPNQALADKSVEAKVKVKSVQKEILPKLNDEFAKKLGSFSSLAELKKSIQQGLTYEKTQKEKNRRRAQILKILRQKTDFKPPQLLIKQEAGNLQNQYRQEVEQMGMSWDDYLQKTGLSEKQLQKTWRKQAEKNIKNALILREVAGQQSIGVSEQEIEEKINHFLKNYPDPQKAKKEINLQNLRLQVAAQLRNEKTLQYLEQNIQK